MNFSIKRSNSLRTSTSNNQRIGGMMGSTVTIQPLLPVSTPQLSTGLVSNSQSNEELGDERPKSAQETSCRVHKERGFPETPPSPSIKDHHHDRPSGLDSSRFASHEGLVSPDLIDNEADDISNDSYLIDKDNKSLTTKLIPNNVKSIETRVESDILVKSLIDSIEKVEETLTQNDKRDSLTNNKSELNKNINLSDSSKSVTEEIEYTLHRRKVKNISKDKKSDKRRRAVSAPRMRCKIIHKEFDSCHTLFARANRFNDSIQRKNSDPLHFVSLHSLPSLESYSSRDDTLQDSSQAFLDNIASYPFTKSSKESVNSSELLDYDVINQTNNEQITSKQESNYLIPYSNEFTSNKECNIESDGFQLASETIENFQSDIETKLNYNLIEFDLLNPPISSKSYVLSDEIIELYLNEHLPDDYDRYIKEFCREEFDTSVLSDEITYDLFLNNLQKFIIDLYLHRHFPDDFDKQF